MRDAEDIDESVGNTLPSRARAKTVGRPVICEDIRLVAMEYSGDVMRALAEIALDPAEKAQSRVAAGQVVIAYAHGRPKEVDTSNSATEKPSVDFSRLNSDELATVTKLISKARGES